MSYNLFKVELDTGSKTKMFVLAERIQPIILHYFGLEKVGGIESVYRNDEIKILGLDSINRGDKGLEFFVANIYTDDENPSKRDLSLMACVAKNISNAYDMFNSVLKVNQTIIDIKRDYFIDEVI